MRSRQLTVAILVAGLVGAAATWWIQAWEPARPGPVPESLLRGLGSDDREVRVRNARYLARTRGARAIGDLMRAFWSEPPGPTGFVSWTGTASVRGEIIKAVAGIPGDAPRGALLRTLRAFLRTGPRRGLDTDYEAVVSECLCGLRRWPSYPAVARLAKSLAYDEHWYGRVSSGEQALAHEIVIRRELQTLRLTTPDQRLAYLVSQVRTTGPTATSDYLRPGFLRPPAARNTALNDMLEDWGLAALPEVQRQLAHTATTDVARLEALRRLVWYLPCLEKQRQQAAQRAASRTEGTRR